MSTPMIVLLIIIPILLVTVVFFMLSFYTNISRRQSYIKLLKGEDDQLLEDNKKQAFNEKKKNWIQKQLSYAGFSHVSAEYVFLLVSIATGFLIGFFVLFVVKSMLAFVFSVIGFSFLPLLVIKRIIASRENEFNLFLKEIIDKVTSMMKSGVGFEQGLKKAVYTSHSKFTRKVFDVYINEKDLIGEDKAFEKMFTMVESKELRIFYLTISIGRQSGGKFSNTLEKLRRTLHDQGEIKQEITSSTREIRIGSYMIIVVLVMLYWMLDNTLNGSISEHFFESGEGKVQMFFIVMWVVFGLFINNLLTKIK